jgi:uncharacterized membrane protein YphA (DoxX/SURF4 family)
MTQFALAGLFLTVGAYKLVAPNAARIAFHFPPDMPPGTVLAIGLVEILGALGLVLPLLTGILPWLTPIAAVGLGLVLTIGALFQIARRQYGRLLLTIPVAVLCFFVVWGRW